MSTTFDETDARTDNELTCPVPGCDYTHESVQGIAGHVPSHDGGWNAAEGTPRDLHFEATHACHSTLDLAARVQGYLARHGVTDNAVRVFYHWGYGNIQIALEGRLGDQWDAFRDATDVAGIHYAGEGVSYVDDDFALQLPEVPVTDVIDPVVCGMAGCTETDDLVQATQLRRGVRTVCRSCRKEFFGVSS